MTRLEKKLIEHARLLVPNLHWRCRHVSFVVIRNRIIALGVNSYNKTSPLAKKFGARDAYIHSELGAIVNAGRGIDLSKTTVYNVRIDLSGQLRMSKPCESCQKLLCAFNVRRCFYTDDNGKFKRFF